VLPRGGLALIAAVVAALILSIVNVVVAPGPANAAAVEAGYIDHTYGPSIGDPTEDKPQSKVWFADGFWWGGLFVDGPDEYRIHKYNATTHTWTDTGVVTDERNGSHGDYLWVGATNSLYVASVNGDTEADPILVFKYNYNPATDTYALDPDFVTGAEPGLVVGTGPAESVTIARDSTGQLWVTYDNPTNPLDLTQDRKIMVNRSTVNEHTWGVAFELAAATGPDDISAIVAFSGNVGVMWSEHRDGAANSSFHFSIHADGNGDDEAWSAPVSETGMGDFAEDHMNLKLTTTASGQVLAAVKTNGGPDHIQVLARQSNGTFSNHVVIGGSQDVTRPQLMIDETNNRAYVFYTSPENDTTGNQAIYYKSAPLSTLDFGGGAGLGTLLIKDGTNDINNVSTAKHNVVSSMGGILAIASSDSNDRYYHGWIPITGGPGPGPDPDPELPFDDIANSPFKNDIVWAFDNEITGGCSVNPPLYCPNNRVTRQQMASFLVRALGLPSTTTDYFADDNSSIHENDINALFEAGVTGGCAPNRFCPTATVTREQMASFLVRGYDVPPSSTDYFTDDNSSIHENDIQALRASGVTSGCTATTYCPKAAVTRGQMAAFLHRAETN
jgi:hypothetical protein